jgi:CubicO group peptidase (beta-lactamase class C family)
MFRKIAVIFAIAIAIAVVVGAAGYYFTFARLAIPNGTGIAAKHLCSLVYVSQLEKNRAKSIYIDPVVQPLSDFLTVIYDDENKRVTTHFFGGWQAIAEFRNHLGCTLRHSTGELEEIVDESQADIPLIAATTQERNSIFVTSQLNQAIEESFADENNQRNTLAVVVLHNGKLITERYAEGINAKTALPGWSMTKSITATLVGILDYQGKIDINAQGAISKWRDSADQRSEITLDQLLRMTSGLEITEDQTGADPNSEMLFNKADGAAYSADRPLQADPGTYWEYMSGSTVLASNAIREIVGESLSENYEFVQEFLFRPLGMSTAILEPDESGTFIGSSFMLASARDWAKFGLLYLNSGVAGDQRLFNPEWVEYVTRQTDVAGDEGYGAGFWINQNSQGVINRQLPADAFSANGFQGQCIYIIPSRDLIVVRLGASSGPTGVVQLVAQIVAAMKDNQGEIR